MKRIRVDSLRSKKHRENLVREIELLRGARHPNIVRLYSVSRRETEYWLVLEFCAGGDLQHWVRKQPRHRLSEVAAHLFFAQLAAGLLFMAERGLIHRDLKPANLLLSEESPTAQLKIADFGFARGLAGDHLAETQVRQGVRVRRHWAK